MAKPRASGASGSIGLPPFAAAPVAGHSTQYYDDGYRVSWETDGQGDGDPHWTNQGVPKGKRHYDERHTPPPDAFF